MSVRKVFVLPRAALWTTAVLLAACGPDSTTGGEPDGSVALDAADARALPDVVRVDRARLPDAAQPECRTNEDCDGGFCVSGKCCPTQEQVCGSACCQGDEVCFANACVVPGAVCHSAADCEQDEYCEFGLGPDGGVGDGGVPSSDGGVCLRPSPAGRCVALPPRCDEDGGVPDGGVCIQDCEYHPPSGGPLQARAKWSWNPETVVEHPDFLDVWATPAIGRLYDTNCDGQVDDLDPPNIVFVSGNSHGTYCCAGGATYCKSGILRVLDGLTGQEIWSLRRAESGSMGFAGLSVAIADVNRDGNMEIVAATGEGKVALIDHLGNVIALSEEVIEDHTHNCFGWGGGLALADMDGDGEVEVAYGRNLFTITAAGVVRLFVGSGGRGGAPNWALSLFADVDVQPDGNLELVAGNTVYRKDGSIVWQRSDLPDGLDAVADLDRDGMPEVVLVRGGQVWVLAGADGGTKLGPATLPGSGSGGPPTVADFDGDGWPEIGVAQADYYSVLKPNLADGTLELLWQSPNHDLSSSVTGSTVFDFEGDGAAEVVYNDECFLWVYDGTTGQVRFAALTTSFTATESSLLADVDGDGHAEMVMISNGANPGPNGWKCDMAPWNEPDPNGVRPAWVPPSYGPAYRGITVFGDVANSWVGTRTLWNQHTYHVTNICDPRDSACNANEPYGVVPFRERKNWEVSWLNNFRQNVQDQGLFNAPDATVSLAADCTEPVVLHAFVRNLGTALLPAGVVVGFYTIEEDGTERKLYDMQTDTALFPGQVAEVVYTTISQDQVTTDSTFMARIEIDPNNRTFHECREDNNDSEHVKPNCAIVE